jgi:dihydroorotase/N-acyl-D-amino-acid deacylase
MHRRSFRRVFTVIAGLGLPGLACAVLLVPGLAGQAGPYSLVFRNARIVDGTGNAWYRGDLAISGDAIAEIAPRIESPAIRTVDVRGMVVAPGFVDLHTHARRGIFEVPTADNYVRQGVTTVVEGPDGSSPLPLAEFLAKVAATRISPNFASFVGQGSIRERVVGRDNRRATPEEIVRMKALVRQGMLDGAFGLSSGLFYVPGVFTPTEEVVELARVAGEMGGIYISHMRNEAQGVLDSVRETIAIGEQGHLPTQVTHHKIIGRGNWGRSVDTLRLVAEARTRGVDASIDQYPYTASSTGIGALLPSWAQEGSAAQVAARLRTPDERAKIKEAVIFNLQEDRGGGDPKNVVVANCAWDPGLNGRDLADITRTRGQEPTLGNAAETALWIVERGGAQGIFHAIDEPDLERILRDPITMIASDGEVTVFGEASPHPRSYGTFARVLSRYVRERRVLVLEDAVRKMTSAPAQRIGLQDRGILRVGLKADLAVFDPATVRDAATFERPHQYAEGFSHVVVNGEIVFEEGRMTSARPGRVLYGPAKVRGSSP